MLVKIYILISLIFVGIIAFVRLLESRSVFFPSRYIEATPKALGLVYEDVFFMNNDQNKLHGWYVQGQKENGTLLFFHGNAGNISNRLEKIKMFHDAGLNVFIFDYRGYGQSEGVPSEKGLYEDAIAAYDYLVGTRKTADAKIVLYGASLGGAVAIDLITKRSASSIIVDSSFSNAADVARKIYPFIPSFLLKAKFDSLSKIRSVSAPKLFIHSKDDEIIPISLGEKLFDAAPPPKAFYTVSGGHNDSHLSDAHKFMSAIQEFSRLLKLI